MEFFIRRCVGCQFAFVANPWTDYPEVYSDAYYRGEGADPLVDYAFELEHPSSTVRLYEWRGILKAVNSLLPISDRSAWLDFGCGAGGLVRYLREQRINAIGFDEGSITERARTAGIPILRRPQLRENQGKFDVVTAIEVLEHVERPLDVLAEVRALLKPGGLFFYTTGNAKRYHDNLPRWPYVIPEIHISFFEPETLALALRQTGFKPEFPGYLPGFNDILRYKVLKSLKLKNRSVLEALIPWWVLSPVAETYFQVLVHPIAWAE